MARISSYDQDSSLNIADKLLGTDSATGATKNFTIDSVLGLANDDGLVQAFDGSTFQFTNYVAPGSSPQGIINLNEGSAVTTSFSTINQIFISVKDTSGLSLAEYLDNTADDFIKISKKDNLNNFGIFEVTAIESSGSGEYRKLTVTPRGTNGDLTANAKYFVANYSAQLDQDFSDDSITEFGDVNSTFFSGSTATELTAAGSGSIITNAERTSLTNFTSNGLVHGDVVDNLTTNTTNVPLSANQGLVLKGLIDTIDTLLTSDDSTLDDLQEVVDFIKVNKSDLQTLTVTTIPGLQTAINAKEDSVAGKGLSANDFTNTLLTKLDGIEDGAEVNVAHDYTTLSNKPTDVTVIGNHSVTGLSDVTSAGSGAIISSAERDSITSTHATFIGLSSAERTKLTGIDVNTSTNVVTDGTDSITVPAAATDLSDITNAGSGVIISSSERTKLSGIDVDASAGTVTDGTDTITVLSSARTIELAGTTNEIEVSPTGAQDLSANRTFTIGLPNDVTIGNDLTVTNDITGNSIIKSGGTSTQILLADGSVIDLTIESQGITSNDSDAKVPSNAAVKDAIDTAISNLVDGAPTALDTLNELAAALGDDASFSTTVTNSIGNSLRFDSSQTLTSSQKTQALTNLGITSTVQEINFLDGVTSTLAYKSHTVTVGSKTGGGNAFYIDGGELPVLIILPETKYRFDLADSTNFGHDFQFTESIANHNPPSTYAASYTTNVTAVGTPGQSGSYIEITGSYEYPNLHYYSPNSTGMGNRVKTDASTHLGGTTSDNIEFDHDLILDSKIITKHSNTAKDLVVTVVTKTAAHPAFGTGDSDGYSIDGIESPELTFAVGNTYKFDISDSSNAGHALGFYYDEAKTTSYTTGVTTSSASAGSAGAYIQIIPTEATPNTLYFQSASDSNMGWKIVLNTRNLTGFTTDDLTEGANLYYTTTRFDSRFDTRLATKDTSDLSEGSNLYYTNTRADTRINLQTGANLDLSSKDTDNLSEGSTNLYYTNTRADARVNLQTGSNLDLSSKDTGDLTEGSNLYYTDGRVLTKINATSIGSLSDVDITTSAPSSGQVLKWDGANFVPGTDNSGSAASDSFKTISVSGQTDVVADSSTDTLTLVGGTNVSITTDASTDTVTINSDAAASIGVSVINSDTTAAADNLYVLTANLTLTLPSSPSAGDSIKISNRSAVETCVIARNGSNIMGSAANLTLDNATSSFELIYSDATNGWVIIGQ